MILRQNILLLFAVMVLLTLAPLSGQKIVSTPSANLSSPSPWSIKAGFQFWNTYTIDHKLYDEQLESYISHPNSWSSLIRRARINTCFRPSDRLVLQGNLSADQLGKDDDTAIQGGVSNTKRSVSVLDLYARYKIVNGSDLVWLTVGLQRPVLGRETIVSSLLASSFEKSISQYYQRYHVIGFGNGRTVGLNIGGQYKLPERSIFIKYNMGAFTTPSFYERGSSDSTAPLISGRIGVDFGDPESTTYSTTAKTNYFGTRYGLSLATSFSYQNETSVFDDNLSAGIDVLFNHGFFNMDGELFVLQRNRQIAELTYSSLAHGGYLRVGYTFKTQHSQYVEPVVMYTFFQGASSTDDIGDATFVHAFSGSDSVLEIGVNYHLSKKTRISMFYTANRSNDDGELSAVPNNLYHFDSLSRQVARGNHISLGFLVNL